MFRSRTFILVLIAVVVMIVGYGFTAADIVCTHCPKPPRPPVDVHYSHHPHHSPCRHSEPGFPVHHYHSDCQYGAHPQYHFDTPIHWYGTGGYHPPSYTHHTHGRHHSDTVYYIKYPTSSVRYINRRHPLVTGNY